MELTHLPDLLNPTPSPPNPGVPNPPRLARGGHRGNSSGSGDFRQEKARRFRDAAIADGRASIDFGTLMAEADGLFWAFAAL